MSQDWKPPPGSIARDLEAGVERVKAERHVRHPFPICPCGCMLLPNAEGMEQEHAPDCPLRCVVCRAVRVRGNVVLTVAHLNADGDVCSCDPRCSNPAHLKAMCARCHLRYDHDRHVRNARRTRFKRRAHRELFDDASRDS